MLYDAYEMQRSLLAGASTLANIGAGWMQNPANPLRYSGMGPIVASALDVFAHASAPRGKPEFGLDRHDVIVEGKTVAVEEEIVLRKPFGQLKHFRREGRRGAAAADRRADVGPLCDPAARHGRADAAGHDVYITDWRDAKLVPLETAASISTIISII
jgi:poly(3-hydroxybutyrate) depolymerase